MNEKKSYILSIRIDETMKQAIERQAAKAKRSISNYIYLLLESELLNQSEIIQPLFIKD